MLPEIVEQGTEVRARRRHDREALTGPDLGYDQERTFVLQYRGTERTRVGSEPQPGRVLHHRGGEGGQRVNVDRIARCLFDCQPVGTEHYYRLHAIATQKVPDYIPETGHEILRVDQILRLGQGSR
jgi:hypothetical protein